MTMRAFLQRLTAPPVQVLRVLQPTPTTVSYTVSTRPVPKTLPAILAYYVSTLVRVVAGLTTAFLLLLKLRLAEHNKLPFVLIWLLDRMRDWQLPGFMKVCQWRYIVPGALVVGFLVFRRGYTEESLTVLRGLGIQTSTTSSTYMRTPTTRFIPTTSIQDIFIHEAFKGFEVRFYLAVVIEGEQTVVVVFPRLLPKRAILEEVWRGARMCLWEGKDVGNMKNGTKGKETG